MMRQSASRNQRSKGVFRLKHFLQICLLLAVCTWLLYQLKHSHDKKKAFEDNISKITTKATSKQPDLFNFGRKVLPIDNEIDLKRENHSKDDDNEEGQEEEGEQEQDMKQEETEDEEVKRDGDDMIDELDQDAGHEENEQEEEFTSEEEKDGHVEEDGLFDKVEHEDNTAQEAREENYKRDDASSAVAHDARGLDEEQEVEDSKVDNLETASNGTVNDAKNIYSTSLSNLSNVAFGENMTVANADLPMNGSHSQAKELDVEFMKPEKSIPSIVSTETTNQKELQPNTTISTLPDNNLEVTAIPSVNASSGEISRLGSSGLFAGQDQNISLTNETSREGSVESQDLPTSQTRATTQIEPGNLSQNAVTVEGSETPTNVTVMHAAE